MKKTIRKEIRANIETAVAQVLSSHTFTDLSKKTRKQIVRGAKKVVDSIKAVKSKNVEASKKTSAPS